MKILITILLLITINGVLKAQQNGGQVASSIAQRMKDSLALSDQQTTKVYSINMHLHYQKLNVWQQYKDSADSVIAFRLQQVENSRDSLYGTVLTSIQYSAYLQKKRNLVRSGQ